MENFEQCALEIETANVRHSRMLVWISSLRGAWQTMACLVRQQRHYRARRRSFRRLLCLDKKMLADIGVTREEVLFAEALPLSVNAADELQRIALQRRRKENAGKIPR